MIPYSSEEDDIKKLPNLFNNDLRSKLLETSSRMTVAEISKDVVGGWWKTIPDVRISWFTSFLVYPLYTQYMHFIGPATVLY